MVFPYTSYIGTVAADPRFYEGGGGGGRGGYQSECFPIGGLVACYIKASRLSSIIFNFS